MNECCGQDVVQKGDLRKRLAFYKKIKFKILLPFIGIMLAVILVFLLSSNDTMNTTVLTLNNNIIDNELRFQVSKIDRQVEILKNSGMIEAENYVISSKNSVVDIVKKYSFGKTGSISLIDDKKTVIFSSLLKENNVADILNADNSKDVLKPININGENYYYKIQFVDSWKWHVIAMKSETELFEDKRIFVNRMILVSTVIILVLVGISIVISNSLSRPIIRVSNKLRQIAESDNDALETILQEEGENNEKSPDKTYSIAEISELYTAFLKIQDKQKVQLHIIKEKSQKMLESIECAEYIQRAVLPTNSKMNKYLPDHFLLWKPRDIVGGDIYWSERFEDHYLIAAIDCIGHGVPGAFMTMVATSVLNRVAGEVCNNDPAYILQQINAVVKVQLNQLTSGEGEFNADMGFEMALCCVIPKEKKLIYSGAKVPLYIKRSQGEVEVIKGDKQDLGYRRADSNFKFTNHIIELKGDEIFYVTSDGFVDQKGGEKGLGLGRKSFIKKITEVYNKPFNEQRQGFDELLVAYKGENEPTDDVLVLGFRPTLTLED